MVMNREFKFGDKVVSEDFGKGVVIKAEDEGDSFPIKVAFECVDECQLIEVFTPEGHYGLMNRDIRKNIRHMNW